AVLFGLFPALRLSRRRCGELLNGSRSVATDPARSRARNLLVASEFALAVTLLTGAGLLLRSYLAVESVDLGFQPEHVLTLHVSMPAMSDEQRGIFYSEMLQRVRALPGVQSIGAIDDLFE